MNYRIAFLLAAIAFLVSTASAQHELSIDSCVVIGLRNHSRMKLARMSEKIGALAIDEFRALQRPQVKLQGLASYAPLSGSFGYDPVISNQGQLSGQLALQQTLYDGGIRGLQSDELLSDLRRLQTDSRITARDVAGAIREAFIDVVMKHSESELFKTNLNQLSDYRDLVKRLNASGQANSTDLLKTNIQVREAEITYAESIDNERIAKVTLLEAMGLPSDSSYTFVGSLTTSVDTSVNVIPGGMPEIPNVLEMKALQLDLQKSQMEADIASRSRYPVVSFLADAGLLTSIENLKMPSASRSPMVGVSAGIAVELPILSWGAIDLQHEQKMQMVAQQQELLQFTDQSIRAEYSRLSSRFMMLKAKEKNLSSSLDDAINNFTLTKATYAGGAALAIEVLSAQQSLSDIKFMILQTQAEICLVSIQLQKLLAKD